MATAFYRLLNKALALRTGSKRGSHRSNATGRSSLYEETASGCTTLSVRVRGRRPYCDPALTLPTRYQCFNDWKRSAGERRPAPALNRTATGTGKAASAGQTRRSESYRHALALSAPDSDKLSLIDSGNVVKRPVDYRHINEKLRSVVPRGRSNPSFEPPG
jgi:hypothetical protein